MRLVRGKRNLGLLIVCTALAVNCAAPSNQEQSASPEETAQGVVSDQFELRWELDGTDLLLAIDTDLPDYGELSVWVKRIYFEVGSDEAYVRDYFDEVGSVSRWRMGAWGAGSSVFSRPRGSRLRWPIRPAR